MATQGREVNRKIYESLTALGVPKETALRFLISYRFGSIRKFSKHIKVSHTSVMKSLRHGHKNVREIVAFELFNNFNPF